MEKILKICSMFLYIIWNVFDILQCFVQILCVSACYTTVQNKSHYLISVYVCFCFWDVFK